MEVKVINGDITNSGANIIGHQTNCFFVMGGGVAWAIRQKWPKVYNEYVALGKSKNCPQSEWLGTCQLVQLDAEHYVANLFGQDDMGHDKCYTNYDALKEALVTLHNEIQGKEWVKTVAFPWLMSCGLAGGDWNIVKPLVENIFSDLDIELQWWKF